MRFTHYEPGDFFDEMFDADGEPRSAARALAQFIETLPDGELLRRQQSAERALLHMGITFGVYGDSAGTERIFPFDLVPRIVAAQEWNFIERGLKQRIHALNLFIDDVYHEQPILKDGVVPAEIVRSATTFREACVGLNPPRGIWCHITGTDLVRDEDGQIYVLEDNLRCPSGVSYVLQNRLIIKRTFPQLFEAFRIRPVDDYPQPPPRHARVAQPGRRRDAARRRAHARAVQLGLLRALVPGAADGRRAGRGTRPRRLRRLRLDADDARASSAST